MLKTTKQVTFTGTSNTDDGKALASFNANVSANGQINIGMNTVNGILATLNAKTVQDDFAEFIKQAYAIKDGEQNDQTETATK